MTRWSGLRAARPLAGILAAYLLAAGAYSLLTPAWEASDEPQHVQYVEHIVREGRIPVIAPENGHESHQPPLYYKLAALWQRALGIPDFHPGPKSRATPAHEVPGRPTRALLFAHDYDAAQRQRAIYVHELRLLSVMLGLVTVAATYAAGLLAFRRRDVALAGAAFVALLPKFHVISGTVTNDSLVVALTAVALVLLLASLRPSGELLGAGLAFALGGTLGAATMTKLNALPLTIACLAALVLARVPPATRVARIAIAGIGFLLAAGWWFGHNERLYDDPLAREASRDYLDALIPGLIAPADTDRFLYFVPESLLRSAWYTGGWNQWYAPFAVNLAFALLAAVAVFAAVRAIAAEPPGIDYPGRPQGFALVLCTLAGLGAVVVIAVDTVQAEGRVMFVGLGAFALLAVYGLEQAVGGRTLARRAALATWPLLLAGYTAYVFARFVVPFRGI